MFAIELAAASVEARRRRPRFEPTDLSMQAPGQLQADLEFGVFGDNGGLSLQVPDFETNLGLTRDVEFDVDGTAIVAGLGSDEPLSASEANLWLSLKFGLLGRRRRDGEHSWGVGVQLGPRVAAAPGSQGLGGEVLLLVARHGPRWSVVANAGAYQDPPSPGGAGTDRGLQAGIDFTRDLTATVTFEAELFGVFTNGVAEHQAGATAGLAWQCAEHLAVSVRALGGFMGAGPGWGVTLGFSPMVRLWR